jgi:hypothetical protein
MNDLASRGISELGLTHLIYYGFVNDKKSLHIDLNKMFTNCNELYIDKVDKTETKLKVTCVPIFELEKINKVQSKPDKYNDEEYKRKLFNMNRDVILHQDLWIYFKPFSPTKPTTSIDWKDLSVGEDVLSIKPRHQMEYKSNRENWLSNYDLRELLKRYTILKDNVKYLGVFYLQAFDNLKHKDAIHDAIERSRVWKITKDYMNNNNFNILMGHIVRKSHWSALIINKKHKVVFYFCSIGNDPKLFPHNWKNVYFYSNTRGFLRSANKSQPNNLKVVMMHKFLSMFTDMKYTVYLNVDQCQNLDGECGTFSSMFLILYLLHDIRTSENISQLYNFFRFFGDKKMSMLRSLLFVNKQSDNIVKLDKSEWNSMYDNLKRVTNDIIKSINYDIQS